MNEILTTIVSRYSYDAKDWVEVKGHGKDNDRDDVKVGHLGRCLVPQPTCFFSSQMGTLSRRWLTDNNRSAFINIPIWNPASRSSKITFRFHFEKYQGTTKTDYFRLGDVLEQGRQYQPYPPLVQGKILVCFMISIFLTDLKSDYCVGSENNPDFCFFLLF